MLTPDEWQALSLYFTHRHPDRGLAPPSLIVAIGWLGHLSRHLGRKGDGMPGIQTLWHGWRDLQVLVAMYQATQAAWAAEAHRS